MEHDEVTSILQVIRKLAARTAPPTVVRVPDTCRSKAYLQADMVVRQLASIVEYFIKWRSVAAMSSACCLGFLLVCLGFLLVLLYRRFADRSPMSLRSSPLAVHGGPQSPLRDVSKPASRTSTLTSSASAPGWLADDLVDSTKGDVMDYLSPGIHTEGTTFFFMSPEILQDPNRVSDLTIYGRGGNPVMACSIKSAMSDPEVSLSWFTGSADKRGQLASCRRAQVGKFVIRNLNGRTWATLELQGGSGSSKYVAVHEGLVVLVLVLDGAFPSSSRISALAEDGEELARVKLHAMTEYESNMGPFSKGELVMMVHMTRGGVDSVLVLISIISALTLGGR